MIFVRSPISGPIVMPFNSLGKKLKTLRQRFLARSMLNKCAKFHGDSPSGFKVNFNLARVIELSETADFVYNFRIETQYKRATSVAHLTNFFL